MSNGTLELIFLWHMHQPDYRGHVRGEFTPPWVYLHALKDYTDMAAHLEGHVRVHAVVNFGLGRSLHLRNSTRARATPATGSSPRS